MFANTHESLEILAGKTPVNDPENDHEAGLGGKEKHVFHKEVTQ